ncbi:dienelactone hydrolase family protein [Aquabacter sp. CN5-332]|uniref:dienelactone hydrolase family protein n=1 Tax=Aquabacter sp. CN5-332 TaxID=3156608 RepID=UPI0032B3942A
MVRNEGSKAPASRPLTRRAVLAGFALLAAPRAMADASPEALTIAAAGDQVAVTRFAAAGSDKRPAVLLLHGSLGVELSPKAYERHAQALAAAGIDAYLVRYYDPADMAALDEHTTKHAARLAYRAQRFAHWAEQEAAVAAAIARRPESSGRIGLLGFSLGGYVAAATAARDPQIAALAVMYGGMPPAFVPEVTRLPPLIVLHGEADRRIPVSEGEALVQLARKVGAPAELVTYPGEGHGFDRSAKNTAGMDAIARVVSFFQRTLTAS